MEILIILIGACALIGGMLDGWRGAFMGLFLGPIGIIIAAVMAGKD